MDVTHRFLDRVLSRALADVRKRSVKVFTIAFYHDHESRAVSVCVDTETRSRRLVRSSNAYSRKYFWPAVAAGDLEEIGLWNANTGRSLSLGDFALVNLARAALPRGRVTKRLYLAMMEVMHAREEEIVQMSVSRDRLLFCSSGPSSEVEFTWSAASLDSR